MPQQYLIQSAPSTGQALSHYQSAAAAISPYQFYAPSVGGYQHQTGMTQMVDPSTGALISVMASVPGLSAHQMTGLMQSLPSANGDGIGQQMSPLAAASQIEVSQNWF